MGAIPLAGVSLLDQNDETVEFCQQFPVKEFCLASLDQPNANIRFSAEESDRATSHGNGMTPLGHRLQCLLHVKSIMSNGEVRHDREMQWPGTSIEACGQPFKRRHHDIKRGGRHASTLPDKRYHSDTICLMAMTLRLNEQQERALAALAEADGISKQEAAVRAITDAAARRGHEARVREASASGRERYAALLDRLAQ